MFSAVVAEDNLIGFVLRNFTCADMHFNHTWYRRGHNLLLILVVAHHIIPATDTGVVSCASGPTAHM